MVRRYEELCKEYSCKAKVYVKTGRGLLDFGNPDLLVMFTGTMSHKMLRFALNETKGQDNMIVARSHSSSMSALRGILEQHAGT